jgi:hypothetical protein
MPYSLVSPKASIKDIIGGGLGYFATYAATLAAVSSSSVKRSISAASVRICLSPGCRSSAARISETELVNYPFPGGHYLTFMRFSELAQMTSGLSSAVMGFCFLYWTNDEVNIDCISALGLCKLPTGMITYLLPVSKPCVGYRINGQPAVLECPLCQIKHGIGSWEKTDSGEVEGGRFSLITILKRLVPLRKVELHF